HVATRPFFFQAEDGIRDKLVTGVQTCALPICVVAACVRAGAFEKDALRVRGASGLRRGEGCDHLRTTFSAACLAREAFRQSLRTSAIIRARRAEDRRRPSWE